MVQELKGKNGKIVGSKEYFKMLNHKEFISTLMTGNKGRWEYYYVLGGSSVKLKESLTGKTGELIKVSLRNIAQTIKNDLEAGKNGVNYIVLNNRVRILQAMEHLSKCGMRGMSSLKSKIVKLTFLEDFNGHPVIIPSKYESGNPVNVKLLYKGNITYVYIIANVSYLGFEFGLVFRLMDKEEFQARKAKVEQGLKEWAGDYTVFGGQKVRVYVNVLEKNLASKTVKINLIKNAEFANSLGGKKVLGWDPEKYKVMNVGWDDVDVYKHEFGHSLGLGDAYRQVWIKKWYELNGVNADLYEDLQLYPKNADGSIDMVMNNNGPVRNNDIEMVLLAFSTGKRQNYQNETKEGWRRILTGSGEISEALGRGN